MGTTGMSNEAHDPMRRGWLRGCGLLGPSCSSQRGVSSSSMFSSLARPSPWPGGAVLNYILSVLCCRGCVPSGMRGAAMLWDAQHWRRLSERLHRTREFRVVNLWMEFLEVLCAGGHQSA